MGPNLLEFNGRGTLTVPVSDSYSRVIGYCFRNMFIYIIISNCLPPPQLVASFNAYDLFI